MKIVKGYRLYVRLSPSQTRRRLRGQGLGVRKVESAGTGRALIIHTATGNHLQELEGLFMDVLEPPPKRPSFDLPDEEVAVADDAAVDRHE
jgi:hypothetical protein